MNFSVALFLALGVPLIILSLGFFFLSLKLYRSKDKEPQAEEILRLAQSLDRKLNEQEIRIAALEEFILASVINEKTYSQ
jgi:hypothetical protein